MNWKMKNKVRILESTYKIDKKNKVVVCELKVDMQMHKNPAYYTVGGSMWRKRLPHVDWDGQFTVRAKARCNASDTFNETIGKRIAESRAKAKMFAIAGKVWLECSTALLKESQECSKTMRACLDKRSMEIKHVEELIK